MGTIDTCMYSIYCLGNRGARADLPLFAAEESGPGVVLPHTVLVQYCGMQLCQVTRIDPAQRSARGNVDDDWTMTRWMMVGHPIIYFLSALVGTLLELLCLWQAAAERLQGSSPRILSYCST